MAKYDLPVNDTTLGYSMATQFSAFALRDPGESIGNWLRDDLGGPLVQYITAGNANAVTPRRVYAKVGSKTLVVIQCTENNASALALWTSYQAGESMSGAGVRNGHIDTAALGILEEMIRLGYYTDDILITGHSQGGAIAHALLREIAGRRVRPRVRAITFGAPKTAGTGGYFGVSERNLCRWMTPDDPVPLIPPESVIASVMGALGDARAARRMTFFVQPAGGRLISTAPPAVSPAVIPPTAVLPAIGNFAAWLAGSESASIPHRISTYSAYLAAYNARYPRPSDQRPDGGPMQRPNAPTPRDASAQEREFVQNVFNAGREQEARILKQPRPTMFYAARIGRLWCVFLNNQQIAVGPTKKRARAIARLGNTWLTRLQRSAYVNPAELLAQVGAVVDAMADPAGQFQPPLRVVLPAQ